MQIDGRTAAATYELGTAERQAYLERARAIAELTLPHLLPRSSHSSGQTLPTPYQSVGARGVSSLSSKLLLALFPPSQSMVRLRLDAHLEASMKGTASGGEIEKSLAVIERLTMQEMEVMSLRTYLHEAIKHLIVGGNSIMHLPEVGSPKVHRLDRFVIKRDPSGNVLYSVIRECINPRLLPDEIQEVVKQNIGKTGLDITEDAVPIYTAIVRLSGDKFQVWQEVCGAAIQNTVQSYSAQDLPFLFLRMEPIAGESYAYGYAGGVFGDLNSLDGLMKALVEASAASSRVVFLVNPASSIQLGHLNKAPNGAFVSGLPDDIVALKVDKGADMSVAFQAIERLTQSLGYAFLLNKSVQRSAERVTAEEIRFLAQELEDVLAGTYALLARELQLRVVELVMKRLERRKDIPKLPAGARPTIVTGLDALGRGHDLSKLDAFVQGAVQALGPDVVAQYLNTSEYLTRRANALGIVIDDLIRSPEEVQQSAAAAQQSALMSNVAPEALKQVGGVVQAKIKNGN